MACKLLVAGVLGASLLSTAAFAATTNLGNLDPPTANAFQGVEPTGPISEVGTFFLTKSGVETALSATIAVFRPGSFTPGALSLFSGSPSQGELCWIPRPSRLTARLIPRASVNCSAPGAYFAELTGTVNVPFLAVGATITTSTAVPEPSTWVMLTLGFAGLGYAVIRRSSKDRKELAI